jgi:hypothetical protein
MNTLSVFINTTILTNKLTGGLMATLVLTNKLTGGLMATLVLTNKLTGGLMATLVLTNKLSRLMNGLKTEYTGTNQNPPPLILNHESFIPFTVYKYYDSFPLPPTSPSSIFQAHPNHKKSKHNKAKNNTTTLTSQLCLTPVQLAGEITCTKQCAAMSNVASGKAQHQTMARAWQTGL